MLDLTEEPKELVTTASDIELVVVLIDRISGMKYEELDHIVGTVHEILHEGNLTEAIEFINRAMEQFRVHSIDDNADLHMGEEYE